MSAINSHHDEGSTLDLDRIHAESFVEHIDFHAELPSTNDRALALCTEESLQAPVLVITAKQTAGRGRGTNRWWSQAGALTFSVIVNPARQLPADRWPQVSLTVGLAICETLRQHLPAADVGLKWPNDVHLFGRKVCGILVEVPPNRNGQLVIGVGLNVNNSFAWAPAELQQSATALCDVAGHAFDASAVLIGVLQQLERELSHLGEGNLPLRERWQQFCALTGKHVEIETGGKVSFGYCQGIDAQGALILLTETGEERFFGGVIRRYE